MEKKELLNRWHELLGKLASGDGGCDNDTRMVLQERQTILHRLNELGQYDVEGVPIVQAMEENNVLLRQLGHGELLNAQAAVSAALNRVYGPR